MTHSDDSASHGSADHANREYYDAFAARYEAHRGGRDPGGYHDLVDELEASLVERYGRGKDVLEVGCGTGLVLQRIAQFAKSARGIDLSPGMLEKAQARGLDVVEGSAARLPFPSESFDVTCSFKVLAHIPDLQQALAEMVRVTRPGGHVIAELYNALSLRTLVKKLAPAGVIAPGRRESDVFTRFDFPWRVRRLIPPGAHQVASRGIRVLAPSAALFRAPVLGPWLHWAERSLSDSPLRVFGGFWIVVLQVGSATAP